MTYHQRIINKVQNFLYHMGARGYMPGSHSKEQRRKFRKIKRIALKRQPWLKNRDISRKDLYMAIYYAFKLHKFNGYGGYYWPDFRPLITEPDPNSGWFFKRRTPTQEELSQCRTWSLHGPRLERIVLKEADDES